MNSVEPLSSNAAGTQLMLASREAASDVLARFVIGGDEDARGVSSPGAFSLPMELLAGQPSEAWATTAGTAAENRSVPGIKAVSAGDWLVCELHSAETREPLEASRQLYSDLLRFLNSMGFPHIVKCWNYLSDINKGEGDVERYKQFCIGRGEALEAAWHQDYWPAATGVGNDTGNGLRVTVLASRQRPELIENPRQVSAFRYPRQYGPKSPNFSRAAVIGGPEQRLLFISGTAAIVGHDSLHTTSVEAQVDETLRNWSSLFDAVANGRVARPSFSSPSWYRVYLRRPDDLERVQEKLTAAGLPLDRTLFLRADICRRELLFEMDGVLALTRSG